MFNRNFFMAVVVAALATATLAFTPFAGAQQNKPPSVGLRPDAPPYAVHGPYWVGTKEFVIPDKDAKRPLPATVWYPALNPDGKEEAVTYTIEYPPTLPKFPLSGHAIQDAKPDSQGGPYPLVLFSHGAWGWRYANSYFMEHLASYGFVVISADHVGDTPTNIQDKDSFIKSVVTRPRDITREIDFADTLSATGGTLDGLIDMKRVAVSGDSSGGWTAFLAAGARRDFTALNAWCTKNPEDQWTCGTLKGQDKTLADLLGLSGVPTGLWPSVGDPRVTAIVVFAPGLTPVFGKDGMAAITVPAMILAGSMDALAPFENYAKPAYEGLGSKNKALVVFEQGNHMIFGGTCDQSPWGVSAKTYWFCSDPVWDLVRTHDLTNHFATAFLLDVLKGDQEAHKALMPDAVKFPGIEYQTTIK